MTKQKNRLPKEVWLLTSILIIAVALVAYLTGRSSGAATPAPAQAVMGPLGDQARRAPGDPMAIGKVDAPVVMVMFSDYRCPFCAKFSRETEPVLVERYVNAGLLRIEWRDFPIFGEQSQLAARAGRAAANQGKFWEFNRAIYANSPDRSHPDLTPEVLKDYAVQVGMPDLERFREEMASSVYDEAIATDLTEGQMLGVTGTPSFVINGIPLVGAQPLEVFTQVIDTALRAGRR